MSSLYDYSAPAPWLVHDGLQARADWALPSPTSPPSRVQSSSPVSYASSNLEYYYEPHDPRDCVHTRLLCDKRFADLQAILADLERCQCRGGQSTWGRTKSFLKRALSLKSRKRSQDCDELEHAQEQEWPGVNHPSAATAELPTLCRASELDPNRTFAPELDSSQTFTPELDPKQTYTPELDSNQTYTPELDSNQTYTPELDSNQTFISELESAPWPATQPGGPSARAAGVNLPPSSISSAQFFGEGEVGHGHNAAIAPLSRPAPQPQTQVYPVHELTAAVPRPRSHQAAWYSVPPTAHASFAIISPISPSTPSSPGSRSLVSPQSSISSVPSSLFTDAAGMAPAGKPVFSEQTTASPVEYGQDDDIAPWDKQPSAVHHGSLDSGTTLAELSGSYDTGSEQVHWLQRPLNGQLAELEGVMPLLDSSVVPVYQPFGGVRSMGTLELATGINFQPSLATRPWYTLGTMSMEKEPVTSSPDAGKFHSPAHSPARRPQPRPRPRPLLPQSQHSYDSTKSTALDVSTLDDTHTASISAASSPPPEVSFIYELPSQQTPAPTKRKSPPLKRRKVESEPTWCEACDFHPSPTGWRQKMEKHNKTAGHRKRTGQLPDETMYPCLLSGCPSEYNREDNMRQHARVVHGIEQSPEGASGRKRRTRREADR